MIEEGSLLPIPITFVAIYLPLQTFGCTPLRDMVHDLKYYLHYSIQPARESKYRGRIAQWCKGIHDDAVRKCM